MNGIFKDVFTYMMIGPIDADIDTRLTHEWHEAERIVKSRTSEPLPPFAGGMIGMFLGLGLLTIFGGPGGTIADEIGAVVVSFGAGAWFAAGKMSAHNREVRAEFDRIVAERGEPTPL